MVPLRLLGTQLWKTYRQTNYFHLLVCLAASPFTPSPCIFLCFAAVGDGDAPLPISTNFADDKSPQRLGWYKVSDEPPKKPRYFLRNSASKMEISVAEEGKVAKTQKKISNSSCSWPARLYFTSSDLRLLTPYLPLSVPYRNDEAPQHSHSEASTPPFCSGKPTRW